MNRFVLNLITANSLGWILLLSSCNFDKLPKPIPPDCDPIVTYNDQIRPIIERNCSYEGCHDGIGANPPGNLTTFDNMRVYFNSEGFERFVIFEKDNPVVGMPPSYAPAGRPQDLTDEELTLFQDWINCGYLEN